METITREQYEVELKKFFIKVYGKSISEAKKQIKEQLKLDEFDNDILVSNVRMFYSDNTKFESGKGFYLTKRGFTGSPIIKL